MFWPLIIVAFYIGFVFTLAAMADMADSRALRIGPIQRAFRDYNRRRDAIDAEIRRKIARIVEKG